MSYEDDIPEIEALLAAIQRPSPGALLRARVARFLSAGKSTPAAFQEPKFAGSEDHSPSWAQAMRSDASSPMPTPGQITGSVAAAPSVAGPVVPPSPTTVANAAAPAFERAWVVDCETTGLSQSDRIVSFGAVEMEGYYPTGRMMYLVFNPDRPSHPMAARVHGWKDNVLAKQNRFREHASVIREALQSAGLIVGHNLDFDLGFINREMVLAGLDPLTCRCFCTMLEYRGIFPNRKAKLDLCIREIGLKRRSKSHGALEDAMLAANLYAWMHDASYFSFGLSSDYDPFNMR